MASTLATAVTASCSQSDSDNKPDWVSKSSARPNVLYITADDLGTRLGAYGHDVDTPHIDALAAQGILFEECHVQSAICGGSRTAILTGLRPETSGVETNEDPWRGIFTDTVTLPRHFKNNGYNTYAIGKIEDPRNGKLDDAWTVRAKGKIRRIEEIDKFFDSVSQNLENPFFACVGFFQPHCPWSDTFRDLYPNPRVLPELGPGRKVGYNYLNNCVPGLIDIKPGERVTLTEDQALDIARGYLAAITELDDYVGRTIALAKSKGLLENTIVIFWSGDHGYALGDHGRWGKWLPKQHISRIPLIVKFPEGQYKATHVSGLVESIDMYPTLLDITGLPQPPQKLDGTSWLPLIGNPGAAGKDYVFTRHTKMSGVSDGRWNFVRHNIYGEESLFDRHTDPDEMNDLIDDFPDIANRLRAKLDSLPSVLTRKSALKKLDRQRKVRDQKNTGD